MEHQLFQNEDGWLVAAPFEYTGEQVTSADIATTQQVATDKIPGVYKLLTHRYKLDHTQKELATPVDIVLHHDGTIDGDGIHGTWTTETGTSYVTIMMNNQNYNGVMVMQTLEPSSTTVPCFTALRVASGVTVWGYRYGDHTGIADVTMDRPSADAPYYDLHGRRVSGEPKKGLYIHNGKKYVR